MAELEALPAAMLALPDDEVEKLDTESRALLRAHPQLTKLRVLEIVAVFSGNHNDPESWWGWADQDKQEERIKRFKRKCALEPTDTTDPLSILVVMNMLLTGFDAPVEQVLYLDRKIVAHDLLQAIARVNRTSGRKKCGYVVDYIGVARHLHEALKDYDGEDTEGALVDIGVELPKLLDRRARAVLVFTDRGITDLQGQVDACVQLLEDLRIRADFINKLRMFYELLNILEHRPEVPGDVFRDAKLLGFINKVAANLYRDATLDLLGVAEKVKALINAHVAARGVDPKIPPTTITDAQFEKVLAAQGSRRARAVQMQHAARFHIVGFSNQNPAYARKMSEKLEEILQGAGLVIQAPEGARNAELARWAQSKLLWVHRKLAIKEQLATKVREPEFVTGEGFSYLGRSYRLAIRPRQDKALQFDDRGFYLRADERSSANDHFRCWYLAVGKPWIERRVKLLAPKAGVTPSRVEVGDLGYRWGSCGKHRVVFFNWRLLQLPVCMADYVIVHELGHLLEPHHGPAFSNLLDRCMPDWRKRREELTTRAREIFFFT